MKKLVSFIKQTFLRFSRLRYRGGYGVHSPFAFDFICRVVEGKGKSYNYGTLPKRRLERLAFRVADYVKSTEASQAAPTLYRISSEQLLLIQEEMIVGTSPDSVWFVEGIHRTAAHRKAWRRLQAHSHTGITFDAYVAGIVFFDRRIYKQAYKTFF